MPAETVYEVEAMHNDKMRETIPRIQQRVEEGKTQTVSSFYEQICELTGLLSSEDHVPGVKARLIMEKAYGDMEHLSAKANGDRGLIRRRGTQPTYVKCPGR